MWLCKEVTSWNLLMENLVNHPVQTRTAWCTWSAWQRSAAEAKPENGNVVHARENLDTAVVEVWGDSHWAKHASTLVTEQRGIRPRHHDALKAFKLTQINSLSEELILDRPDVKVRKGIQRFNTLITLLRGGECLSTRETFQ